MRSPQLAARAVPVFAIAAVLAAGGAGPSAAKGENILGEGNEMFLNDEWSGRPTTRFYANIYFSYPDQNVYGNVMNQTFLTGDWNGDGEDSFAVRDGREYHFKDDLAAGPADRRSIYGRISDVALVGDWDGDGRETPAVRRGNVYYFRNRADSGPAERVQVYGRSTDQVLVGDWDGDGVDTLAVRRVSSHYFTNDFSSGPADHVQIYGRLTDQVLVGDWDGDGADTLGVRRSNRYHLTNTLEAGPADTVVTYGTATDVVFPGDWNADGKDTPGILRAPLGFSFDGVGRVGADVQPGTYRSTESIWDDCSWERRAASPETGEAEVVGSGDGLLVTTIGASDAEFGNGCGTWFTVEATHPPEPRTTFGDGTRVVGHDVEPGTYTSTNAVPDLCRWVRLSGFGGTPEETIQDSEDGWAGTVTISATDAGFHAAHCGEWVRDG